MIDEYLPPKLNQIIKEDLEKICSAALPWEKLQNKKIMVTGGAGFLASYLVQGLIAVGKKYDLNIEVICVVRNLKSAHKRYDLYKSNPRLSIFQHDISLPLPPNFPSADVLIHSASQASPRYYGVDPVGTLCANSIGTMYLLEHAVKCTSQKFLFFSSGEVYGQPVDSSRPIGEDDYGYLDSMKVRSCYAESKRMGETMCAAWSKQYELDVSVVRPFHTYGPGMALDDGRVFADFVADIVAGRDIAVKGDGLAMRPFCYLADATLGFLSVLLKGGRSEAYNIGNPQAEISIRDLAILLSRLYPEKNIRAHFASRGSSNQYINSPIVRSCPDISKAMALGWEPRYNLEDGFRRTIESFLLI